MNEISEGKLARLALVGAIVLGVASGNAAQVSNREINNWKRDFNSLTIKDKKKVLGMIDEGRNPVAKNINKFNKPKTFTDRKKRDKRGYEKHKGKKLIMGQKEIEEKLSPSHGVKAYIDDFQKSDAPQFQGKSAEKRRDMAIAAYLSAKRGTNEEVEQVDEDYSKKSTASLQKTHDKWKNRPMSPASANQLKMIRRELQKRGAMQKEEVKVEEGAVKKKNKTYKNTLDALRGARYKLNNPAPERDVQHKTAQQQNKAIGRSLRKEEVEQVDELKKSTLASYIKKSAQDQKIAARFSDEKYPGHKDARNVANKRGRGISMAADKLAREEVEQVDEVKKVSLVDVSVDVNKLKDKGHEILRAYERRGDIELEDDDEWDDGNFVAKNPRVAEKLKRDLAKHGAKVHVKVYYESVNLDEVSKDMKKRYLDKAIDNTYKKWIGKEKTTKQQLDKRRARIQKVSKDLTGKKHFSDFGEEVEQVDELKKSTLASYIKKATVDSNIASMTAGSEKTATNRKVKMIKRAQKRYDGIKKATDRLAKEEVEQVDEGRYRGERTPTRKAQPGMKTLKQMSADRKAAADKKRAMNAEEVEHLDELSSDKLQKYTSAAQRDTIRRGGVPSDHKRARGMGRANRKIVAKALRGEEVEQVDELSNATHMSYSKKAGKQVSKLSTANKKWRDARNAAVSQSNKGDIDKATSNIDKNNKTIAKRKMGLARSYQSRSEEVEQVDESGVKSPPIKGVPVVSLSDVSNNSDYKKDRYGRRVPKRLKNNDPRVRFMHKEDVEQVDEAKMVRFIVMPTVDKGKVKKWHSIELKATSAKEAREKAAKEFGFGIKPTELKAVAKFVGEKHMNEGLQIDESQKLADKRTELRKKMFGDANYLSPAQRKQLDAAAKAELKKEREAKKAAPKAKTTTKTAKGKTHTGSAEAADKHIIMQMRKAQDYGAGKHPIRVSPTRTVNVPHTLINKALQKHDAMVKPEAKRTFRIQLIKSLRKAGK